MATLVLLRRPQPSSSLPRRWPWLLLAAVIAACAFVALSALHTRERRAHRGELHAALFAAQVRAAHTQIRRFAAQVPPDEAEAVIVPVVESTVRAGQQHVRAMKATVDDPRVQVLQRDLATIGSLATQGSPVLVRAAQLAFVGHHMAATADGIAAGQRRRSDAMGRETILGGGAVLLVALLVVAAMLQRSHVLVVRAGRRHAATLRDLADHDHLTGLPNRRRLADDVEVALLQATPEKPVQVLICDLDGFKQLNDSLGHEAGDEHLAGFAERIAAAVGADGTTYRLGGDEFCVLSRPGRDVEHAVRAAAAAATGEGELRASVGRALLPTEAPTPRAAMRLADERMYAVKARARASAA